MSVCWFSAGTGPVQGTVILGVKVSSLLKGWMEFNGQEGFSLHNKWVQSKFLTVLSCQLFDLVYISVS